MAKKRAVFAFTAEHVREQTPSTKTLHVRWELHLAGAATSDLRRRGRGHDGRTGQCRTDGRGTGSRRYSTRYGRTGMGPLLA